MVQEGKGSRISLKFNPHLHQMCTQDSERPRPSRWDRSSLTDPTLVKIIVCFPKPPPGILLSSGNTHRRRYYETAWFECSTI